MVLTEVEVAVTSEAVIEEEGSPSLLEEGVDSVATTEEVDSEAEGVVIGATSEAVIGVEGSEEVTEGTSGVEIEDEVSR